MDWNIKIIEPSKRTRDRKSWTPSTSLISGPLGFLGMNDKPFMRLETRDPHSINYKFQTIWKSKIDGSIECTSHIQSFFRNKKTYYELY